MYMYVHVLVPLYMYMYRVCLVCIEYCAGRYTCTCFNERWEKEERKKQAKANKQTRQSNTAHPRLTSPRKNAPQVGFEPTPLYSPDRALYQLSYRGSTAGWAQISHLIQYTCTCICTSPFSEYSCWVLAASTAFFMETSQALEMHSMYPRALYTTDSMETLV